MARQSAPTDFFVDVPGIGTFSFAQRKMSDEMRITAEYSRLTEGVETPTTWLEVVANWISALKVLTVTAPAGWDVDEMDPLDEDTYANLGKVHGALRDKETSFRQNKAKAVQAQRTGNSEGPGVLVPTPVQPGADGSPVP